MTRHITLYTMQLNNLTVMISGTYVIWSFPRLDIGTHISYLNEFYWSTSSNIECQWYGSLKREWLKYQAVLIIIIVV